jgi:hypothetical protein
VSLCRSGVRTDEGAPTLGTRIQWRSPGTLDRLPIDPAVCTVALSGRPGPRRFRAGGARLKQ